MNNKKDQMHPDDVRNLILFFVISLGIYLAYDSFILKPQAEALRAQKSAIEDLRQSQEPREDTNAAFSPQKRTQILAQETERIHFESPQLYGSIARKGARLDDLTLQHYKTELGGAENVALLSPKGTYFPRIIDHGWVAADKNTDLPGADTLWHVKGDTNLGPGSPITLFWDNGKGLHFERTYKLDENFLFTVTQKVTNNSAHAATLYPYGLATQTGLPPDLQNVWILHEGPIGYIGDKLQEIKYKDLQKKGTLQFEGNQGWTAFGDKYWLTSLIPPQSGRAVKYRFTYQPDPLGFKERGRYQIDYTGSPLEIAPGSSASVTSHIYAGAKKVHLLEDYEKNLGVPHMDLAVDFGMFYFMTKPFFYILHFLGEMAGNMGIAIILLTLLIRGSVFPLTNTSYKSFAKMKKVSPQIMTLRETYKDDKQKLQKEIMELYQREGVNPLSGCFPILLQIPIFFALYKIIFITIEIRHAPFFGWITDLSAPDPTSIFNLFGLLPYSVPGFLHIGVWPCAMLVAMIIQKKLNPPPQDPIQRDMMNYFPFIITYVLSRFASGLVIYWTFSAVISVIQQMIIMRSMGVPIHLFGETKEEKAMEEALEKGPAVHPLIEMAEEEAEEALFGDEDGAGSDTPPKKIKPRKPRKSKKKKK